MGTSNGIATFSDGSQRNFTYQNTSDWINSDLFEGEVPSAEQTDPQPLTEQPLRAELSVDYGNGLAWSAWVSPDKRHVLTDKSPVWGDAPDFANWYRGADGVVHMVGPVSGFGLPDDFKPTAACGHDGPLESVSEREAEGCVCLACFNRVLKLTSND